MEKKSVLKNTLPFLPLLVIYVLVVLVFSSTDLVGDELRYMRYADNLTNGFYAEPDNPELRNGPGYPMVIAAFVLCKAPFMAIKLLNALLSLGAILFFFKTISRYVSLNWALFFSYFLGLYPPYLKLIPNILSEPLAFFLVCGFLFYFIRLNNERTKRGINLFFSILFLGSLILTKIIFGYVVLCLLLPYFMFLLFKRKKKIQNSLIVLAGSLMLCVPYLFYTYSITGKTFMWGTGGGEILYWRTTPFPQEYGDWISADVVLGKAGYEHFDHFDVSTISKNHGFFIRSIEPYSYVQRDSIFKAKAVENMKEYPVKYFRNTLASSFRLFFNYPYSYTPQKTTTYFYIVPNMFLLLFLLSAAYLVIRYVKAIPFEIWFLGFFALVFIAGLVLLDGKARHLLPGIPLLLFFIIFVHSRLVQIQLGPKQ